MHHTNIYHFITYHLSFTYLFKNDVNSILIYLFTHTSEAMNNKRKHGKVYEWKLHIIDLFYKLLYVYITQYIVLCIFN